MYVQILPTTDQLMQNIFAFLAKSGAISRWGPENGLKMSANLTIFMKSDYKSEFCKSGLWNINVSTASQRPNITHYWSFFYKNDQKWAPLGGSTTPKGVLFINKFIVLAWK